MSNKPYKVEDKAKEILNVFKENGIKPEDIDFKVLEKALKSADKTDKESKYISLHCPYCGSKIFLCVDTNKNSDIFEEIYNCTNCGNDLDIQYDTETGKVDIGVIINLLEK